MKKLFIISILPLFLSACLTPSPSTKTTQANLAKKECHHQKAILENFLIRTNSIEMSAFLEEDMVREAIRPLSAEFDIDTKQCSGYTAAMRDEATSLLLSRRDEFKSYLLRICGLPTNDENYDVSGMAYNQKQHMAAIAALEYLKASTDECYK
jgi:hypothetical protein